MDVDTGSQPTNTEPVATLRRSTRPSQPSHWARRPETRAITTRVTRSAGRFAQTPAPRLENIARRGKKRRASSTARSPDIPSKRRKLHHFEDDGLAFMKSKTIGKDAWLRRAEQEGMTHTPVIPTLTMERHKPRLTTNSRQRDAVLGAPESR